jgi:hypothetical protein
MEFYTLIIISCVPVFAGTVGFVLVPAIYQCLDAIFPHMEEEI